MKDVLRTVFRPLLEKLGHRANAQYVDLGLSVKWATCNLGASNPEEYGDYFAWGETKPKEKYTAKTSLWRGVKIEDLQSKGVIDERRNLTPKYDAATENLGSGYRMPTEEDWEELRDKCTWTWTTRNGVDGGRVTGPNGNSIFLPAAGSRYGSGCYDVGSDGHYWSSSPYDFSSASANVLNFDSSSHFWHNGDRGDGLPIRPVMDK